LALRVFHHGAFHFTAIRLGSLTIAGVVPTELVIADVVKPPHISRRMLMRHLDPDVPTASRSHAFIERSVDWLIDALDLHVGSSVLDLECGPGLYATRLARHGIETRCRRGSPLDQVRQRRRQTRIIADQAPAGQLARIRPRYRSRRGETHLRGLCPQPRTTGTAAESRPRCSAAGWSFRVRQLAEGDSP